MISINGEITGRKAKSMKIDFEPRVRLPYFQKPHQTRGQKAGGFSDF
jgi:hypothetical protein